MPNPAIDELVRQLNSLNRNEVADAVRKLGKSHSAEAIAPLCDLLQRSTDKNLVRLLVKEIGRIGDRRVLPTLIELFKNADRDVQRTTLKAFLRIGVFEHVLPPSGRDRRMVQRAVLFANPEIIDLIERNEITADRFSNVLPPIM